MLFPQVYSILLAGSFLLGFCRAFPSVHFVYRLPRYTRLSIFNQVSNYVLRTSIDKIKDGFKLTKERSRRYHTKTITDTDYTNDIVFLANAPAQTDHVNAHKPEYICFNQTGDISTLNGSSLKLVDKFIYLGSSVSSTETDIDTWRAKAWTAINRLSVIWKSDQTNKMKHSFFQAVIVSILLYGCTTWTKRMEKKLDGNYTRMLWAILNKSWR